MVSTGKHRLLASVPAQQPPRTKSTKWWVYFPTGERALASIDFSLLRSSRNQHSQPLGGGERRLANGGEYSPGEYEEGGHMACKDITDTAVHAPTVRRSSPTQTFILHPFFGGPAGLAWLFNSASPSAQAFPFPFRAGDTRRARPVARPPRSQKEGGGPEFRMAPVHERPFDWMNQSHSLDDRKAYTAQSLATVDHGSRNRSRRRWARGCWASRCERTSMCSGGGIARRLEAGRMCR